MKELKRKPNELKAQGLTRVFEDGKVLTEKTEKRTNKILLEVIESYPAIVFHVT